MIGKLSPHPTDAIMRKMRPSGDIRGTTRGASNWHDGIRSGTESALVSCSYTDDERNSLPSKSYAPYHTGRSSHLPP